MPSAGFEPATLRSSVSRSPNWATKATYSLSWQAIQIKQTKQKDDKYNIKNKIIS